MLPTSDLRMAPIDEEGKGTFGTEDVLNGVHHLVRYSQLSNLMSVPTDCPQRERRVSVATIGLAVMDHCRV